MATMWSTAPVLLENRLDAEFYLPSYLETVRLIRETGAAKLLGDIEVSGSYGVLPKSEEYGQGPTPLLRGGDLDGQSLGGIPEDAPRVPTSYLQSSRARLRPNEVLLLVKGATIDAAQSVGVVPSGWSEPAIVNGSVYKFGVRPPHDPYYVCAFFGTRYGRDQKTRAIANTGINYNDQGAIRSFWLVLPDPGIQRAIGNRIRKAERLRDLAKESWDQIESTLATVMGTPDLSARHASFFWVPALRVSPYRLNLSEYHPSAWKAEEHLRDALGAVELRSVLVRSDDLSGGATPKGAYYPSDGVSFLRSQNVQPNRLALDDLVYIDSATDITLRRSRIRDGDVLLTITGFYRGIACVARSKHLPANINQHSVRFQLREGWDPFFVAAFLNSPWGQAQIDRRAIGATRPALDYPSVLSLLVPMVKLDVQQCISDSVVQFNDRLDDAKELVDAARAAVENLIDGTLDEAVLVAEGNAIEQWLAENPSPHDMGRD